MKRRGRPPHPDVLTPREWDVLSLVREGLSNPQIAERLAISPDAAKYHVSEILSKLGVSTREEAAAWQPEPPERPELRPAWARALGPIASLWRAWPIAARIAGAAVVAAAVAGLGLLLYGVLRSGDNNGEIVEGTPTVASSVSRTGGPSASSTPAGVAGAIPLSLTAGVDLPQNLALIIETGCINCDGPTTSLLRVYRAADGNYATDTLFTPATVGVGPATVQTNKGPEERQPGIAGFAITPDASDIVVGTTYGLDLGPPTETTTLFRSRDGGIIWSDFGSLAAGDFMSEDLIDGQIIVGHYGANTQTVAPSATPFYPPPAYRLYPSGDPIQTPPGANAFWQPARLSDGTVGWRTDDGRLLSSAGDELLRINGRFVAYRNSSFNPPGATAVVWSTDDSNSNNYLQVLTGKSPGTYSLPLFVIPGAWALGSLALGSVSLPEPSSLPTGGGFSSTTVPALIDLKDVTVKPITGLFGDAAFPRGRNFVAAAMVGPRARVTDTGSCLNVRAEPSATAAAIACAADGVLLENLGPASDTAWLHVRTPAGIEGYASVDYLQVIGQPASQD